MSTVDDRVSFGIKTCQSDIDYAEILRIWREADETSVFEHAWLWDHLVPWIGDVNGAALEAWTLLATLAAQTSRLRLGVLVTSNRLRPPALLAKMAATVDVIAGGRLIFGIGVGGSAVSEPEWLARVRREYDAYGIDIVPPDVAVTALGEACTIIRRLWDSDQPFDFAGSSYRLTGAVCEPKPVQRPHPPILIGASGNRALRVVAQHADIWDCPTWHGTEELRRRGAVLDRHCADIGRDPTEIVRSAQVFVRGAGPVAIRDELLALIEAGARQLVLSLLPPTPSVAWLAEQIVAPVLAARIG